MSLIEYRTIISYICLSKLQVEQLVGETTGLVVCFNSGIEVTNNDKFESLGNA